ncbi:MAG TPA: signal peptidase I [Allosphingosinicella sp.]
MNAEAAPRPRRRWWLRWPVLAAVLFVGLIPLGLILGRAAGYKPFHIPAEAMEPTLKKGDRIIALMRAPAELKRGDLILFDGPDGSLYLKRLAGLPGDRIAMDQGIVVVNGRRVEQELTGEGLVENGPFREKAQILTERFDGEAKPHRIFDTGFIPNLDDFEEMLVAPGHVFLLGDNRDVSADSRVSPENMGLGQVPISSIRGKALFHSWGSSRGLGEPVH